MAEFIATWCLAQLLLGAAAPTSTPAALTQKDPFSSYRTGDFQQALKSFLDLEVDRPDDPRIQQNIGSTHYKLKDFEHAEKRFAKGLANADKPHAAKLQYNLGNTAYQQGRLDHAAAQYQKALEIDPKDEDAKHNLEFVRQEIQRREQQKKEQEQQQKDEQNKKDQQKPDETKGPEQPQNAQDKSQQQNPSPGQPPQKSAESPSPSAETGDDQNGLNRELAERYLQNLVDERPKERASARDRRTEKDW